jgi:voltage-gated potassium channel
MATDKENLARMASNDLTPRPQRPSLIERRALKIADARSTTYGLAVTFVVLAFVIRFADRHDFSSFGSAVWWALQTVTTVGYGDIVPTTAVGQTVGGIVMVLGVSFIAFLTAGVTSTVISRAQKGAQEADRTHLEGEIQRILDALAETKAQNTALDKRLDLIESKLS